MATGKEPDIAACPSANDVPPTCVRFVEPPEPPDCCIWLRAVSEVKTKSPHSRTRVLSALSLMFSLSNKFDRDGRRLARLRFQVSYGLTGIPLFAARNDERVRAKHQICRRRIVRVRTSPRP